MLIADVVVFKPKLSEAGPAILAVPVGVGAMEAMALALGFTGAAALALDINQNPSKYNRAMRGMGTAYTSMMSWFKDNPESDTPPRGITADLENQTRQAVGTQSDEVQSAVSARTQEIINQVDKDADAAAAMIAQWSADARAATDAAADAAQTAPDAAPTAMTQGPELVTPDADLKGGEIPTGQVGDNDVNLGLNKETPPMPAAPSAGKFTPPAGTTTPPAGALAGATGAAGALAGANAISKATSNATSATKAAGATGAAGKLPRLPISLGNVSADQMKFGQISVRDPLNLKRYG